MLDGPALQIYAEFTVFLPILMLLRTISVACIARTMHVTDDFFHQSALKWLARSFAVFTFVIAAVPMCAEGQVIGTSTVTVELLCGLS